MKVIKSVKSSTSKVTKFLQGTYDKHWIETGYYNLDEHILCLSTQIDCLIGCIFCASGQFVEAASNKQSSRINLTAEEIVQQAENVFNQIDLDPNDNKRVLFSYMGTGEPLLNYNNVVTSIDILAKKYPNSRTTISTVGIVPGKMRSLAKVNVPSTLKLHLSLHAPTDRLRRKIMKRAGKIEPALEALLYFSEEKEVTAKVNYSLIENINDSPEDAVQLSQLLEHYPFIVKLSALNPYRGLRPASSRVVKMFEDILRSYGLKVSHFFSIGKDIKAGCGQFKDSMND